MPKTKGVKRSRQFYIGAHTSIKGGHHNALQQIHNIGGNACALFPNSQRQWKAADVDIPLESRDAFKEALNKYQISVTHILPHGSYLANLGSPDATKLERSRHLVKREMARMHSLGLKLYNFHPGSTLGQITPEQCCDTVAASINWLLGQEETGDVVAVIENTAGQGNTIGNRFEHLSRIINGVENKERVGVCIDTCHAFAAGYDLRTQAAFQKTFDEFDRVVGFQYLRGMHINDSKADLGSRKDRHENLGLGKIGWRCFEVLMHDDRFQDIPLVLETPKGDEMWSEEISKLFSFESKELSSSEEEEKEKEERKGEKSEIKGKPKKKRQRI